MLCMRRRTSPAGETLKQHLGRHSQQEVSIRRRPHCWSSKDELPVPVNDERLVPKYFPRIRESSVFSVDAGDELETGTFDGNIRTCCSFTQDPFSMVIPDNTVPL